MILNTRSVFILIVAVGLLLGGLLLGGYAFLNRPQPAEQTEVPGPQPHPLHGVSISLAETSALVTSSQFDLKFPTDIRSNLRLTDYRASNISPMGVSFITLVYSERPLAADATRSDLLDSGGFMMTIQKRTPGSFESLVEQLFDGKQETERGTRLTIGGNPGFYGYSSGVLRWIDGDTEFELITNASQFSMEEVIRMAESVSG